MSNGRTAAAAPARICRSITPFSGSPRSPSPAMREREGPTPQAWEGEGLSVADTLTGPRAVARGHPLPQCGRGATHMIFNAFERMVAFRYLRARRQEGFVSVIAIFSLLGIALGVATLIIVMSVMNGFRADLIGRILGLNGHLGVYGEAGPLNDFDTAAAKVRQVPGVASATPLSEAQATATAPAGGGAGGSVRRTRPE